jgi:type II secretory pathway component PulC
MRTLAILSVLALATLGACADSTATSKPAAAPASPAASAPPPAAPASSAPTAADRPSDHAVARAAVHAVLSDGLGAFLERVDVDDQPVFLGGKFHGFRIAALRDGASWAGFWSGVDLKPGDVVTSINGFPIEHPEQAQTAFESLEVASELRVAYERAGEKREIVYAIVDR